MAKTTVKVTSFVKEVLARFQGDQDAAVAEKNKRSALAAAQGQLAALNGELVDAENEREVAQEKLHEAKYPTERISDRKAYWTNVVRATERVEEKEELVVQIQNSIKFAQTFIDTNF